MQDVPFLLGGSKILGRGPTFKSITCIKGPAYCYPSEIFNRSPFWPIFVDERGETPSLALRECKLNFLTHIYKPFPHSA